METLDIDEAAALRGKPLTAINQPVIDQLIEERRKGHSKSPVLLHQLPSLPEIVFISQPAMIPLEWREDEVNHMAQLPALTVRLTAD